MEAENDAWIAWVLRWLRGGGIRTVRHERAAYSDYETKATTAARAVAKAAADAAVAAKADVKADTGTAVAADAAPLPLLRLPSRALFSS